MVNLKKRIYEEVKGRAKSNLKEAFYGQPKTAQLNRFNESDIVTIVNDINNIQREIDVLNNVLENPTHPFTNQPYSKKDLEEVRADINRKRKIKQGKEDIIRRMKIKNEAIDKINATSVKQMENAEKERFGRNYFARDYIGGVTGWTGTAVGRKPKFNQIGLRMEWVSPGYVGPSGLPAIPTIGRRKSQNLSMGIGTFSGFGVRNIDVRPNSNPNLSLIFQPVGKGEVIMPQVLKFKKRRLY